jgi:hypothetical protein
MIRIVRGKGRDTFEVLKTGQIALPIQANEFSVDVASLTFTFRFETRSGSSSGVESASDTGTEAVIRLINFNSPLGTSFDSLVGSVEGQELWLCIIAHAMTAGAHDTNDVPRLVNYTFFTGGVA